MIKYGYKGLNKIKNGIQSKEIKEKGRNSKKYFTRKRKMDFEKLIHYILTIDTNINQFIVLTLT